MLAWLRTWQGSRRIETRRGAQVEDGDDEGAWDADYVWEVLDNKGAKDVHNQEEKNTIL